MNIIPEVSGKTISTSNVFDSKSRVAPFRVVNIGNSKPTQLLDFVAAFEQVTGRKAIKNYLPMQSGDVQSTWADTSLLFELTGYRPNTELLIGVNRFVSWYKEYFNV